MEFKIPRKFDDGFPPGPIMEEDTEAPAAPRPSAAKPRSASPGRALLGRLQLLVPFHDRVEADPARWYRCSTLGATRSEPIQNASFEVVVAGWGFFHHNFCWLLF